MVAGCIGSRQSSGLSPQDHAYLNAHVEGADQQKRLAEKRAKYSNNPKALAQIDMYDLLSDYGKKQSEERERLKRESENDLASEPGESSYARFRKQQKREKKDDS